MAALPKKQRLHIDMSAEARGLDITVGMAPQALIVPHKGVIIPFHCKMIKNINRQLSK